MNDLTLDTTQAVLVFLWSPSRGLSAEAMLLSFLTTGFKKPMDISSLKKAAAANPVGWDFLQVDPVTPGGNRDRIVTRSLPQRDELEFRFVGVHKLQSPLDG